MQHLRRLVGACLGAGFLAACAGGNNVVSSEPPSIARLPVVLHSAAAGLTEPPATNTHLYVANRGNSTVTVYARSIHNKKVLRTISKGINVPYSLAVGNLRFLYVANFAANTVTEYASGKTSVLRTISQGVKGPAALAVDSFGEVFVANQVPPRVGTSRSTVGIRRRCCGLSPKALTNPSPSRLTPTAISMSQTMVVGCPASEP